MGILKWYSIIIIVLNLLFSLIFIIGDDEYYSFKENDQI